MKRLINLIAIVTGFAVITAFARIQAPELIVDAPDDWTITSEENIDAYGSAWDDSGRVAVFVNGDFAGSSNWYKNVALASGTNEITITAVNIYSNITEKIRHVICTANIEDTTPPEIVKVLPPDGFATIFRDIQMKIYATDNIGVESVTVNGESANPHSHKWVYNATLVPGTNEMEIIAKDAAGNQSTKIVDYILHNLPVDTNPPVLVVEKPDDGTETDAECIDVYGTASDDSGYVFVKVNGKCAGMSNWFKKVCLEPGTNEIQIVAIDISSNTTEEVRTVIRIVGEDTTPPEIVKVLPPDGFATIFRDVQMKIYATDNIGVESVTVNGESANPHSHKWVYNATLVPGTNKMEIIAKDAAGNQSTKIVDYILHETNAIDLVVLTTNLHDAIVSNVYKSTLRAIGGVPPYKWSLIDGSLPEYIVLLANGDIIGIAKQVGDYEFTAQVIDANLSAATSAPLHLVVKASGEKPRIITKTLVDAVVKFPYEAPILIDSSDNWTFSTSDELPKGIELTTGGHLKGVPTKTGLYEIEINADNNKGETIDSVISMEVTDKEADTLYVSKVAKSKIAIARNKDRENSDKLVLKLQLTPETGFSLNNKKFSVNIGNYTVPLRVSQYKNYGKQVKLANTPLSNEELTIKGTVKFDKEGLLQLKVKVKNADLEEVLGIENSNQNNKEKHLPIEVVIGNDIAHSVLPMKLKSKEDKKATLKLQK